MPADLHIHTHYSDGTQTPQEIVEKAVATGLTAIAISDHDTVEGIAEAKQAAEAIHPVAGTSSPQEIPLEIIPAVEINAETPDNEVHLLGYFIDWEAAWLRDLFKELQAKRRRRIERMLEKLSDLGIHIDKEAVFAQASDYSVGRPHVARALLEAGYVTTFQEAFNIYLAYGKAAYVKGDRLSVEVAIDTIHQARGVAVLAHPGVYKPPFHVEDIVAKGIDGIEVFYNQHAPEQRERYQTLCQEKDLLMTGGSDFHGDNRPHRTLGSIQLPDPYVTALRTRHETVLQHPMAKQD